MRLASAAATGAHLGLLAGCGGACRLTCERVEAAAPLSFLVDFGSRRIRDASDADFLPVIMEFPRSSQHRRWTSKGRASGCIVARSGELVANYGSTAGSSPSSEGSP